MMVSGGLIGFYGIIVGDWTIGRPSQKLTCYSLAKLNSGWVFSALFSTTGGSDGRTLGTGFFIRGLAGYLEFCFPKVIFFFVRRGMGGFVLRCFYCGRLSGVPRVISGVVMRDRRYVTFSDEDISFRRVVHGRVSYVVGRG